MSQLDGDPPSSASMSAPPPDPTTSTSKFKKAKKNISSSETHINPSPVPEMSSAIPLDANGERQRGPVEEVIAKRMRQLGKKLQRYRTYATQPIQTLNADQRAALISLPSLEGAYKELEELTRDKGPVDEQELIQAARLREATEATEKVVAASAAKRVSDFQDALVQPLSRFLRLHALLHPARTSDHEHLILGKLTLSSALREALQPTDLLRVGRLYEDLMAGQEAAKRLLNGLVKGVTGEDEENDRIRHLLDLLDQPDAEVSISPPDVEEQEPKQPEEVPTGVVSGEANPPAPPVPSDTDIAQPNGQPDEQPQQAVGGMALNFLQEDELAEPDIEESYEVVPMLEPHQTSGLQPPFEEAAPIQAEAAEASVPVAQAVTPPAPASRDWAEIENDDEDEPLTHEAFSSSLDVEKIQEEVVPAAEGEPAIALVQQTDELVEPVSEAPPTSVESIQAPQDMPIPVPPHVVQPGAASASRPRPPRPAKPNPTVDEDGFTTIGTPQAAFRGRGGRGGRGGGERGRGGPRGRGGRGGRGGFDRSTSSADPQLHGQGQGQGPRPPKKDGPPQARSSIYKELQPAGPKSAPIS